MTAWILLSVVQPLLVATGRKRVHMMLGKFAMALAVGIIVAGYLIAIGSTRGTPPELVRFGLAPKAFLTVPLRDGVGPRQVAPGTAHGSFPMAKCRA